MKLRDDLEGVPLDETLRQYGHSQCRPSEDFTYLIDQESLSLGGVVHLLRVLRHQRVEERIESFVIPPLGSKNPA